MDKITETTAEYWNNSFNCAQSTACGILSYYEMKDKCSLIADAMVGFGGGMGERSVCGAITGTLAALGIVLKAKNVSKEELAKSINGFKKAMKDKYSLNCVDILADFINEDGTVNNTPERKQKCTEVVYFAAKTAKKILDSI